MHLQHKSDSNITLQLIESNILELIKTVVEERQRSVAYVRNNMKHLQMIAWIKGDVLMGDFSNNKTAWRKTAEVVTSRFVVKHNNVSEA